MAGEAQAEAVTPAVETPADASLLSDAAADAATTPETPAAEAANPESKPADKAGGDAAKAEGGKPEPSLLADDDDGKTPEKADGQTDAEKGDASEYEPFTLPDGLSLDDAALAKATPVFKEAGLKQDVAQKLVSLHAETVANAIQGIVTQQRDGHRTLISEWKSATKADKEIGGDKLTETLTHAKKALNAFGTPELKNVLNEWGLANHPDLVRLLARVGSKLSEDTLVNADATAQPAPKSAAERMWPGMFQKQE